MLHAIKHRHNTSPWNSTRMLPPFLCFDEPNLCNDYIFMNSKYNNQLYFLNQVNFDANLLDNVVLHQAVIQPTKNDADLLDNVVLHQAVIQSTKKTRSVGPHKSKSKTTTYKKKPCIKNKKLRFAST